MLRKESSAVLFILLFLAAGITLQAQKANALLNQAVQYENTGELEAAREILEKLHQASPGNVVYQARLKRLYLRMQAYTPLLSMLEEEIRRNPRSPQPIIEKAQVFHRMGRHDQAIRLWETVIESHQKNRSVLQQVASMMTHERLFREAIQVYQRGRHVLNNPDLWTIQLAGLYSAIQEYGAAVQEYLHTLRDRSSQTAYIESQILRMPRTKQAGDQILKTLEEAVQKEQTNGDLLKLLSRAHLRWGSVKEAYAFAQRQEELSSAKLAGVALLEFAGRLHEPDRQAYAEKAYREILNRYPKYPARGQIWYLLGQTLEVQAEYNAALAVLDSAINHPVKSPWKSRALMLYGKIQRDHKADFPAASWAFRQLLRIHPSTSEGRRAHIELGILRLLSDSLNQAEESFTKNLRYTEPFTPIWMEAHLRLAQTAYYRGEFDTALTVLKTMSRPGLKPALFQHPLMNDGLALRLLIQTHAARSPQALRLFSEARLRIFQKRPEDAEKMLDQLIRQHPGERIRAHALMERAMIRKNNHQLQHSLTDLDTLLLRFPESLIADQALYESARVCEQMGEKNAAMQRYERFLVEHPASVHIEAVRKRIRRMEGDST